MNRETAVFIFTLGTLIQIALSAVKAQESRFNWESWSGSTNATPCVCGKENEFVVYERFGGTVLWKGRTTQAGFDRFDEVRTTASGRTCAFLTEASSRSCASLEIVDAAGAIKLPCRYFSEYLGEPESERAPFNLGERFSAGGQRFRDLGIRHAIAFAGESEIGIWSSWTGEWVLWNWASDKIAKPSISIVNDLEDYWRNAVIADVKYQMLPAMPDDLREKIFNDVVRPSRDKTALVVLNLARRFPESDWLSLLTPGHFEVSKTDIRSLRVTLSNEGLALAHLVKALRSKATASRPRVISDVESGRGRLLRTSLTIPLNEGSWNVPLKVSGTIRKTVAGQPESWEVRYPLFLSMRNDLRLRGPGPSEIIVEIEDLPEGSYEFSCLISGDLTVRGQISTNIVVRMKSPNEK